MTPELWQRLKPLFHAAMEKDAGERADFLERACNSDPELEPHLRLLVQAEELGNETFDKPMANLNEMFSSEPTRFQPGELILGRFRIVRLLGKGGMGEVYEAEDLQLGRIALKTILPDVAISDRAFDRFRREVQLARKLSGLQVCRIHELFLLPAEGRYSKTAFLTMEYLEGITLAQFLDRNGPLPWKKALQIALDLCEGLRLIHQQGIIHRDFKSANVMLCERNGRVRAVLMDFGLAFDTTSDVRTPEAITRSAPADRTLPGTIAGTPAYMAPEQFEARPVSPATDIYALGVVLYELVTGLHPYAAGTPVGAAIRRAKPPVPPSTVKTSTPHHWDRVIDRCLKYEPQQRFQSAEEVSKALKPSPFKLENLWIDHPWLVRSAGTLILASIAFGIFAFWQSRQYYQPSPEEQRWYNAGLRALREGTYLKATRMLGEAADRDSSFAIAHARLAEAWGNLDFDGNAQREMLIATSGERRLQPIDRMYLAAIRSNLTRDFPRSMVIYRQILERLPTADKPSGYVDLGMAYERAGEPEQALKSYAQATHLDKNYAASYLHTAVLDSRLNKVPEADSAFNKAEAIFAAEMNQEGQAELDYERGYLANVNGESEKAKRYLIRSLEEAKQIQSVQLEIRTLTQLSSVSCASGDTQKAVDFAQRAIRLARDNRLDSWAAFGLARLANARLMQGGAHFQEAEDSVTQALALARQSQQSRAEAMANVVLASLRDAEHRPDEVILPAKSALAYYKKNGYFEPAADATLLLLRANQSRGQFQQTLQTADDFLSLAKQSGSQDLFMQAEQQLGATYQDAERYPESLPHFQRALELASNETNRAYQAIACAGVLNKLGRFAEADALIAPFAQEQPFVADIGELRVSALLSQEQYGKALKLSNKMLDGNPDMMANLKSELELHRAIAEAHLRKPTEALAHYQTIKTTNRSDSADERAALALRGAEVQLFAGANQEAFENATVAEQYFASTKQLDSDLHAALFASIAAKAMDEASANNKFSAKAFDILLQLNQNWDAKTLSIYLSRPDLRTLMRVLPKDVHAVASKN